ncbi:MAG: hypothetical protein HYS32_00580 [Candidatus Woesearchaeota archaeon]|nr:MAG: hypothetical protein HYS32_00580 [Candidatus Woesearchaeota archaeon]
MKIYIAGKFEDRTKVAELYKKIEEMGHKIAYDWTQHKPIKPYSQNQEMAREYSDNELSGILDSDIFICLTHEAGTTLLMEFGAALILNKKTRKPLVYTVGNFNEKSPWFFNSLVQHRNSINEVLEEISKM